MSAAPGKESGCGRKLLAALAAASAVLGIAAFLLFQWVRPADEPWLPLEGAAAKGEGRVILLLADRLSYGDLRRAAGPHLARLLKKGAAALMNVRTGRGGSESGYLSLGAGARAAAGAEGREAFQRGEHFAGSGPSWSSSAAPGRLPGERSFTCTPPRCRRRTTSFPTPWRWD